MNPAEEEFLQKAIKEFALTADHKFRMGKIEHHGIIWELSSLELVRNAKAEVIDQWMYLKALETRLIAEEQVKAIDSNGGFINPERSDSER